MVGLGFGLTYSLFRFLNISHGVFIVAGPYSAFLFSAWCGFPLSLSLVLGAACGMALACLIEVTIYSPLRKRGATSLVLLLASLGVYAFFQNLVSTIFGDDAKRLSSGPVETGFLIGPVVIKPIQVSAIAMCVLSVVILALLLRFTKTGKGFRAVANNTALAEVCGVDARRLSLAACAIAGALAAVAGIMFALDVDMSPGMGLSALMMGVIAVIIGGLGSTWGVLLGAVILALAQQSAIVLLGAQWRDPIAFVLLLGFLLFRPQGFLGRKPKTSSI